MACYMLSSQELPLQVFFVLIGLFEGVTGLFELVSESLLLLCSNDDGSLDVAFLSFFLLKYLYLSLKTLDLILNLDDFVVEVSLSG